MNGFFASAEGGAGRAGVLVSPPGNGLGEHTKEVARRLAKAGFAAFALDYYGGGATLGDAKEMMARIQRFLQNPLLIRECLQAALEVLRAQPEVDASRVAAIGYCFGGTSVLELARSGAPIAATVGFHSGLKTARPEDARNIKGKVLVCLGADDPLVPSAERQAFEEEMRHGGIDWQMHVYGGAQHSFTDPEADERSRTSGLQGLAYRADADRRSWRSMLELFSEVFSTPRG
jgi:dienelactone hydrolase